MESCIRKTAYVQLRGRLKSTRLSRVGSAAQTKAMKKVAGQLKLGRKCALQSSETPYRDGGLALYDRRISGACLYRLRASQEGAPSMVRLTKLNIQSEKIGDRVAPTGQTTLLPITCVSMLNICANSIGRVGYVCQRDEILHLRRNSKGLQQPKLGIPTFHRGYKRTTSETKGTFKMSEHCSDKSGERVTDLTLWLKPTSALVCEAPQPNNFLHIAIKAFGKIRNVNLKKKTSLLLPIVLLKGGQRGL
jgi:hypothetical protein